MLTVTTQEILADLPDSVKLRQIDIETLQGARGFIFDRLDLITTSFYDILFGFEKTEAVFREGERSAREASFKHWVELTLTKEINQEYWEWQTYVGLIHVKRGIKNDIFVRMLNYVTELLVAEVVNNVPKEQAVPILIAWLRLSSTVSALIVQGYEQFYHQAIEGMTGIDEQLLDRLVAVEIDDMVAANQQYRM